MLLWCCCDKSQCSWKNWACFYFKRKEDLSQSLLLISEFLHVARVYSLKNKIPRNIGTNWLCIFLFSDSADFIRQNHWFSLFSQSFSSRLNQYIIYRYCTWICTSLYVCNVFCTSCCNVAIIELKIMHLLESNILTDSMEVAITHFHWS